MILAEKSQKIYFGFRLSSGTHPAYWKHIRSRKFSEVSSVVKHRKWFRPMGLLIQQKYCRAIAGAWKG